MASIKRATSSHVDIGKPRRGQQFRSTVDEVGGEDPVDQSVGISLMEACQTIGKQTEGDRGEYPVIFGS